MTKLKCGLYLPEFLSKIGVDSLTAYVDSEADWQDKLFDKALRLYPTEFEEFCDNPVCRRIASMYSPLYEHDQLNHATHRAMHEMFGVANMAAFEHLGVLVRKKKLVNASGDDVYLPHLERLDLPITFIHGEENACFLPESTEATYDLLRNTFDPDQFQRHVIPKYGHIDCIFGKNAHLDVYPLILEALDKNS